MSNTSKTFTGKGDLLDSSLSLAFDRIVEGPSFTTTPQPMGRDTSRPYPGEALLHRVSQAPDRLAAVVAEPHIPGLSPTPEPEQIDMRLKGRHADSSPLIHSNPAEWDRDWQAAGGRNARNNDRDR